MKSNIFLRVILIVSLFLGLSACTNHKSESSYTDNKHNNNNNITVEKKNTNQALVNLYTQAISAFIQAAHIKDNISYDTLYFGKHIYGQADDFPAIELPESIEKTQIRLVTPELGQKFN